LLRVRSSPANSIDVALFTARDDRLSVLLVHDVPGHAREHWSLPWNVPAESGTLDDSAGQIVLRAAGARAGWLVQAGAFADGTRHPGGAILSVAYLGVMPQRAEPPTAGRWFPVHDLPSVAPRHRAILDASLAQLRERAGRAPIAFRLLGTAFTLSDLQAMYELLLGRRLHKASFRRALKAATLVESTDEWRSEGRGRPARLYRYSPAPRSGGRGGIRFELPGD
jgi:8-oxo-dGTP diphosphatase